MKTRLRTFITALILVACMGSVLAVPVAAQKGAGNGGAKNVDGAVGEPVTSQLLDSLNPLKIAGSGQDLSTPGKVVSRFLTVFAFPLAGIILFVMLLWGGFEMLLGAADKKSVDAGKQRITAALIGFLLLFTSYWIARIIELMFGITILGA